MADPATLVIAATAISAATSVASGIASSQQARFQQEVFEQNARLAEQRGRLEAQRLRKDRRRRLGLATAQFAAAGVALEGTPVSVLAEEAANAERDAQLVRFGASVDSAQQRARANAARSRGAFSLLGGGLGAGTSIFSGLSDLNTIEERDPVIIN